MHRFLNPLLENSRSPNKHAQIRHKCNEYWTIITCIPLRNVPPDHGSLGLAIRRADDRILNGYDNGIMVCVYCTQVSYIDR